MKPSSSGKLVIVRHAESEWNALGKWTGTRDVHLSDKGFREAAMMGQNLKDIKFDIAFISQQIRTKESLENILDTTGQLDVPYEVAPGLNERDYGDLTGKNKWQVEKEIGDEAFNKMRRGWNVPVPNGETLKDVYKRVVDFYMHKAMPLLHEGKTILIVAHGNSIRALIKYIESLSDEQIEHTEMIFGTALIYEIDGSGKMAKKTVRRIDSPPPPA